MSDTITITPLRLLYILSVITNVFWISVFALSFLKESGLAPETLNSFFTISLNTAPHGMVLYGLYVIAKEVSLARTNQ